MYDRIAFRARFETARLEELRLKNHLEECRRGDEIYYKSTAYANFDGVYIEVSGDVLRCKCSICKLWELSRSGRRDNQKPMTFAMAVRTMRELLMRLCIEPEAATVSYYEVGLTMRLARPANEYIVQVEAASGRTLWNDANYPEYRQRTTEKSKNYRKVLKIYDKTFEAESKKRRAVDANILRVETVYKHQRLPLTELMDVDFMTRTGRIFFADWNGMEWERELIAPPGTKMSQLEKARELQRIGTERFRARYKQLYDEGKITRKQWETYRTYANHWTEQRTRFAEQVGPLEAEFKQKLLAAYQVGFFMPYRRKA